MTDEIKKPKSKETHYLVLEDLSYVKNGNLVSVKKGIESDVFLSVDDVPQEALNELVERELVKVITL